MEQSTRLLLEWSSWSRSTSCKIAPSTSSLSSKLTNLPPQEKLFWTTMKELHYSPMTRTRKVQILHLGSKIMTSVTLSTLHSQCSFSSLWGSWRQILLGSKIRSEAANPKFTPLKKKILVLELSNLPISTFRWHLTMTPISFSWDKM